VQYKGVLERLKSQCDPKAVEGMARFGINPRNTYGVSMPNLRKIAKEIGTNHILAQKLWQSGIREARIIACIIDQPKSVNEEQLELWAKDFDSWDVCGSCCGNLFDKTRFAHQKAVEWSKRNEEFVKRAGFVLMAELAVHNKKEKDEEFLEFLPIIKRESTDDRNFVKKAVNWALRQIGKRNARLNEAAIETAKEIHALNSKTANWIATDALRELTSKAVQKRLK
jgi:3-methyladenine DNA glycosylase AlkD